MERWRLKIEETQRDRGFSSVFFFFFFFFFKFLNFFIKEIVRNINLENKLLCIYIYIYKDDVAFFYYINKC